MHFTGLQLVDYNLKTYEMTYNWLILHQYKQHYSTVLSQASMGAWDVGREVLQ